MAKYREYIHRKQSQISNSQRLPILIAYLQSHCMDRKRSLNYPYQKIENGCFCILNKLNIKGV